MMVLILIVFLAFVLGIVLGVGLTALAIEPFISRLDEEQAGEDRAWVRW